MFKFLQFAFFSCVLLSSCISHKKTVYFQDNNTKLPAISDSSASLKSNIIYKVMPGDLLFISISSLNKEVTEFYNLSNMGEKNAYLALYQVNDSGSVTIPILGKIEVKGLTLEQVQNKILQKVQETVNDATVIVKLGSFKVTMLGEVNAPSIVSIDGDKGTVFDAIALSGDISSTGDRAHVKIIREFKPGQREIIVLDLLDKRIINSNDIYLKPNDIIYVEPLKAQAKRDNMAQWSRFIGFTSLIYIVFNILTKL